jgi:hypothetical protein
MAQKAITYDRSGKYKQLDFPSEERYPVYEMQPLLSSAKAQHPHGV